MLSHDRDCYGSTGKVAAARKHRRGMVKRTRIAERASSCSRKQSARSNVQLIFTLSQFTNVSIFNLECPGKNKLKSITFQIKRIAFREQLNTHNFPELKISMAGTLRSFMYIQPIHRKVKNHVANLPILFISDLNLHNRVFCHYHYMSRHSSGNRNGRALDKQHRRCKPVQGHGDLWKDSIELKASLSRPHVGYAERCVAGKQQFNGLQKLKSRKGCLRWRHR